MGTPPLPQATCSSAQQPFQQRAFTLLSHFIYLILLFCFMVVGYFYWCYVFLLCYIAYQYPIVSPAGLRFLKKLWLTPIASLNETFPFGLHRSFH